MHVAGVSQKRSDKSKRFGLQGGGQRFAGDSDSPVSIVPHLKLISVLVLKEPYSIEKCATCLDTFLRF